MRRHQGDLVFVLCIFPPVANHESSLASLWILSASALLSVHEGLGMDGWSREECRTKEYKTKFRQTHLEKNTHREQGEGQGRINGCALIDKLIKQTKTSTHTHTHSKHRQNVKQTHSNNPNETLRD